MQRNYTVFVGHYSLEPHYVGRDQQVVFTSDHRAPRAAARKLAELINGKTATAKKIKKLIPPRRGGYYQIKDWRAEKAYSLAAFRAACCQ